MNVSPFIFDNIFQIGFVVPDIQYSMNFFKEKMDVKEFLYIEKASSQDHFYRGKPAAMNNSIAFGYCGSMQVELIQPRSGASTYVEYLKRNPVGGMQHLGILVDDYDQAIAKMEARGFISIQSGRNGETRFAYFDTEPSTGALTEIVYLRPEERERFERLKR